MVEPVLIFFVKEMKGRMKSTAIPFCFKLNKFIIPILDITILEWLPVTLSFTDVCSLTEML